MPGLWCLLREWDQMSQWQLSWGWDFSKESALLLAPGGGVGIVDAYQRSSQIWMMTFVGVQFCAHGRRAFPWGPHPRFRALGQASPEA